MWVLNARNVTEALHKGLRAIDVAGEPLDSRAGKTLELPMPVATVYERPWERVLLSKTRDCNPFFHLMESLWILAGREDVKFLTEFNKRMGEYSDDGEVFNAPYGYRLRNGNCNANLDQISEIIKILKKDPNSRQAVAQIWDEDDLVHNTKDKACNMSIVFRIRNGKLCMIVYNRSNDMIWGAYGANAVQFSMIQEYIAVNLSLPMGTYTQVTNSYHVYTEGHGGDLYKKLQTNYHHDNDPFIYDRLGNLIMMESWETEEFDCDLSDFFNMYDIKGIEGILDNIHWQSRYFKQLIIPMLDVYSTYKTHSIEQALNCTGRIAANDWRLAAKEWLEVRLENRKAKENK